MDKYKYQGPVMAYGRCISPIWRGETMASSPEKARNNLVFRAKKHFGYENDSNLELPAEMKKE